MNEPGALPPRVLAIDPGTKRIGLAVSDPLGITAQGIDTFAVGGGRDFFLFLRRLIEDNDVKVVVVGMPLSMSGGEIEGTARSREMAERIRGGGGVEVVLRDERMTSLEAERILEEGGGGRAAGDVDRLAAVLLLQSYLDESWDR